MNKKSKSQKKKPQKRPSLAKRGEPKWDVVSNDKYPFRMSVERNMHLHALLRPLRPLKGAQLSVRLLASTFGLQTGLSNIGGSNCPGQLIQGGATFLNAALGFILTDFAGYSAYTAAFDQYRIDKVLVRMKSRNNAVSVFNTASPNGGVPTGYIVRDPDDVTALSTSSDYLEYDTAQSFSGEEDVVVELTPVVAMANYAGGVTSGYTPMASPWCDAANTAIQHYGLKIGVGPLAASTTSSWVWDVTAEAIISFMSSR